MLDENHIENTFHITSSISELSSLIEEKLSNGIKHFLFAGGDGTLHHGGNLLIHHAGDQSKDITIGMLPCGTGNDWVITFGVSKDKILQSLRQRNSAPLNILSLKWPDGSERYAFNMVGGALDAAVVKSLDTNGFQNAGVLKYSLALVGALMKPHIWPGSIIVDGETFSGNWITIQAGFGKYCGGGMHVLPHATQNKPGLLLMKPKSFLTLMMSLPKLYNGKITQQPEAIASSFSKIEILHSATPIPIEADGEWLGYSPVMIQTVEGRIKMLVSS